MFAPRTQRPVTVPGWLGTLGLATILTCVPVAVWAAFAARPTGDEAAPSHSGAAPAPALPSVAYAEQRDGMDWIMVRPLAGGDPSPVVAFPAPFGVHLRGFASPRGDQIAVLRATGERSHGRLTLVSLPDGMDVDAEGTFSYAGRIAWAPDGLQLAAVGEDRTSLVVVDAADGNRLRDHSFPGALEVAPIGYTGDGSAVFVVVVDAAGSTLWRWSATSRDRVGLLSPGPTLQWALSPDGARLAYIDRLAVGGGQAFAGRTFVLATGEVLRAQGESDQLGAVWRPGAGVPEFGGPGGTLRLVEQTGAGTIIPLAWSGDGGALVAGVTGAAEGAPATLEVIHADYRVPLSREPGAFFLGFVRDLR
ncbi:MAG: hypothetical protein ACKVVT_04905 [Dehalococcoidia bacterium]